MPASDTVQAAAKAAPHFSIVSLVPSSIFGTTILIVVLAEPWKGRPDWAGAFSTLASPTLGQVAIAAVAVIVLALVLAPLQYPLIQVLEGYWGTSLPALNLASRRIRSHLKEYDELAVSASIALDHHSQSTTAANLPEVDMHWWHDEATRLLARYPVNREDTMPTALGNVLRRYERSAGYPYGLGTVATTPHLILVGRESDVAYVRDQRTQLDLATRMTATCALLCIALTVLLLPAGWWLTLVAIPYLLAHAFYRGACSVAQEYGVALYTLVDLNRAAFYERLGLSTPTSMGQEVLRNADLMRVLRTRSRVDLPLDFPEATSPGSVGTPGSSDPGPAQSPQAT